MIWDYTPQQFTKQAKADPIWLLERQIMYGTDKIDRTQLEKHLPALNIPENKRAFLELLLWNKPF